ncbi:FtsH protease activity modulator HflK [Microvirga sp. 17 mud 1-3]|uniref:FtsH protease activity modulator HflK n=1 Tax=Microvirga sp. 17 mud 1-3 TaxID=2082949 RepID=UPI000D6C8EE7|nr:FtsH protease activity modulator HflK [Microvirga sp. 17 mud 1-3]AWM86278.1 FtsH protease activity modulator HflK [Microvirga sp. 17 mud 1-3]
MPWSNQSGGGPWGQRGGSGGGKSPWGSGGSSGNGAPPDLEDILRRGQDRLKDIIPGGPMGGKGLVALLLGAIVIWLLTGFYTVRPNEVGINMLLGRFTGTSGEGLRYNLPYPLGRVIKPNVTEQQRIEVGYRSTPSGQGRARDVLEESLMLTADENIVDIDFDVVWQVNPARPQDFVFNLQNPEGTIKSVGESAMREVIGRRQIQNILTTEQASVAQEVRQIMQTTLDAYGAGVLVNVVQLQAAQPPAEVRQAFFDVNAAQQDAVRVQNEAETFASRVVPEARGEASRTVQQAEAYREQATADATGQAARFSQIYAAYKQAPAISRERMFLETMERVMSGVDKVIIDQNGQGVVPYLPLTQLPRQPAPQGQGAASGQQGATR